MLNKWDKRFLDLAYQVSTWSKDPKKKVGCVLVNDNKRIISTGYNGWPVGCDDMPEDLRLEATVHAEINALLFADRPATTAYIWPNGPCSQCAAALVQPPQQIKRIVTLAPPSDKWHWELSCLIFAKNNVTVEIEVPYND